MHIIKSPIYEIIISLVSSVIITILKNVYNKYTVKRNPYTGIWEGQIYNKKENSDIEKDVIKKDFFYLKQKGDEITGTAKRTHPEEQKNRRYEVKGKLKNGDFVAIFWATDQSIISYGCWFLTQTENEPTTFKGNYLSISKEGTSSLISGKLIRSKLKVKDFKSL